MKTYLSLAPVDQHPAKAREIDYVQSQLSDRACQGFLTRLELAKSLRFGTIVTGEEDPAGKFEVVRVIGDDSTEQREGHGVEGIFVEVVEIEDRTPIIDWLQELSTSADSAEADEAKMRLSMYQVARDMAAEG